MKNTPLRPASQAFHTYSVTLALLRRYGGKESKRFDLRTFCSPRRSIAECLPVGAYFYRLSEIGHGQPVPAWCWEALKEIETIFGDVSDIVIYKLFDRRKVTVAAIREAQKGEDITLLTPSIMAALAHEGIALRLPEPWERYTDPLDQAAARQYYEIQATLAQ